MAFGNSNSVEIRNSENIAMLDHNKATFHHFAHWLDQLRYHDFNITSRQVQIYFNWFNISWSSWTKKRQSYYIHGRYYRSEQNNTVCKSFISIIKVPFFIFFMTPTTLSSYTRPWTVTFFDVSMLISISWIWIKQSPCGFNRIRPDTQS